MMKTNISIKNQELMWYIALFVFSALIYVIPFLAVDFKSLYSGEFLSKLYLFINVPDASLMVLYIVITIAMLVVPLVVGYFWRLNPWLAGVCLNLFQPLLVLVYAINDPKSNPIVLLTIPMAIIDVVKTAVLIFIGMYIRKLVGRFKEKSLEKSLQSTETKSQQTKNNKFRPSRDDKTSEKIKSFIIAGLKYVVLPFAGFAIIFICSLLLNITPVKGEYYYSNFLGGGIHSVLGMILMFSAALSVGYFWRLNPWVTTFLLFLVLPATSMYESHIYPTSHNLIPFEFGMFFVISLPSVLAVYIGRILNKYFPLKKEVVEQDSRTDQNVLPND